MEQAQPVCRLTDVDLYRDWSRGGSSWRPVLKEAGYDFDVEHDLSAQALFTLWNHVLMSLTVIRLPVHKAHVWTSVTMVHFRAPTRLMQLPSTARAGKDLASFWCPATSSELVTVDHVQEMFQVMFQQRIFPYTECLKGHCIAHGLTFEQRPPVEGGACSCHARQNNSLSRTCYAAYTPLQKRFLRLTSQLWHSLRIPWLRIGTL